MKIFYDTALQQWRAFEAPEKPDRGLSNIESLAYAMAYAKAKTNALEVGNPAILEELPRFLKKDYMDVVKEVHGKESYDWPGSAVVRDGKYYLSI